MPAVDASASISNDLINSSSSDSIATPSFYSTSIYGLTASNLNFRTSVIQSASIPNLEFYIICGAVFDVIDRSSQRKPINRNARCTYSFGRIRADIISSRLSYAIPIVCLLTINLVGFGYRFDRNLYTYSIRRSIVNVILIRCGRFATREPNAVASVVIPLNFVMVKLTSRGRRPGARRSRTTTGNYGKIFGVNCALDIISTILAFTKNGSISFNLYNIPTLCHNPFRNSNPIIVCRTRFNGDQVTSLYTV